MTDEIVYVGLFNEGTSVWRPVRATRVGHDEFVLHSDYNYDLDDEQWEFLPGTRVRVEVQVRTNDKPQECLVAVEALEGAGYIGEFGIAGSDLISIDKAEDQLLLRLRSGGYGRPRGSVFTVVFNDPQNVQANSGCNREVFGLKKIICPGAALRFALMETPDLPCLELAAQSVSVETFPSGWWRNFWESAELVGVKQSGRDLIVSIKGWEYWKSETAITKLRFREAVVLVQNQTSRRQLSSFVQAEDTGGCNRYVFLAHDHERCLELLAKDFVVIAQLYAGLRFFKQ